MVDESPASPGGFLYPPPEGRVKGALKGEGELQAPCMVSTLCLGGDEMSPLTWYPWSVLGTLFQSDKVKSSLTTQPLLVWVTVDPSNFCGV